MDIEALIDKGQTEPAPAATTEPVVEPAPVQPENVEPVVAPVPEVEAETPVAEPEVKDDQRTVPLPTFLDMRDEAKELRRRLAEYEAQSATKPEPAEMPDPIDDPQGFANWQQGQVTQALVAQRFQTSDIIAKQQHGAETVEAAALWATEKAKANPAFAQEYMQQPHPIDWIVRQHKRDGLLSEIGDNVDDWFTREAAKRGYAPTAPTAETATVVPVAQQPQVATTEVPPQSLAGARSTGGAVKDIPIGGLSALETVFQR